MDAPHARVAELPRRLQDPLAELVKIDPKSIGVGQYQHDVGQSQLARRLDAVVEDCVNAVGVDVNTASVALAAGGYWWWNRPAPEPTIEHLGQTDGSTLTRVTPGQRAQARVVIATPAEEALNDKQLMALSRAGKAQLVQVILPKDDCTLQQQALQTALQQLKGPATLVSGIGPGATLAWRWLAAQTNDKAQAVSVGFKLEEPGCTLPVPKTATHGNWLVAWNDNPDDPSAAFVRDQPNAQTSISDYDIHYPQVLSNELRKILVGDENGGLSMPVVEVPAGQQNSTVTLFLSGDGGWRDLDRDVAGEMAKIGYPVVGIGWGTRCGG